MRHSLTLFALLPSAAFAHAGDHAAQSVLQNLWHLVTEPDHLAIAAAVVLAVGAAAYLRKGRAK
ncbi:hypothetical protein EGN72_07910 [Pseudorhodobacter sp. E13]|uniref:HupE/UreJ family protein n=1 Tax=Pseudorhodobacter sp. E13 TaxID=2487931 RepID=UPI000F8D0B79|nr:HupE/UreJ family protein [Pseudorhodobacter sp. E13]RUS60806.1 hypothetical protein EGN72_07910 [Pseudorhodobacter sp. E13]